MKRWRKWLWRYRRQIVFGALCFDVAYRVWWRETVRKELGMIAPDHVPVRLLPRGA